jgi:hypothetical protein
MHEKYQDGIDVCNTCAVEREHCAGACDRCAEEGEKIATARIA